MTSTTSSVRHVIAGVVGLSGGTLFGRLLAAVGQLLLAIWLSPAQFGLWAAANSMLAFVSGLANFGEVNGYLAGRVTYSRAKATTRRSNLALAAVGVLIAVVYFLSGKDDIALLALVVALTIPIAGESDLLYARAVRAGLYRANVLTQVGAAIAKVAVGCFIASVTHSAQAIALSTALYSLTTALALTLLLRRRTAAETSSSSPTPTWHDRISWAANSWMMTLPLQSTFVVAQFVASPHLVGLYFLGYQVTLAVSGVISGPVAKVTLATLGNVRDRVTRTALTTTLAGAFSGLLLLVCGLAAAIAPFAQRLLGSTSWSDVIPAAVILLASLPVRILAPVLDAYQQSANRWWQSTAFNAVDAVGSAAAALGLLSGSVTVAALWLTFWKIALGSTRAIIVLRSNISRSFAVSLATTVAGSTSLALVATADANAQVAGGLFVTGLAAILVLTQTWSFRRPRSSTRQA